MAHHPSVLQTLYATIQARKAAMPQGSYTVQLLQAGEDEILKKIGEEAIEVVVAAKSQGDARVVSELADLLYHSLVLLAARDMEWQAVEEELARRAG